MKSGNLLQIFRDKIAKRKEKDLIVGIFTFSLGILLYFPLITKWLTNPDGIWNDILYKTSYNWEDRLGRFGLRVISKMKGYFIYPSAQTIMNLLIIALIAVILFELFDMESVFYGIGIGTFLICSPSLCSTLTYYYTSDAYMLAYLFSILFVAILAKGKGISSFCIAVFLFFCSMSLYQAYVSTAVTLCLLYTLYLILNKRTNSKTLLNIIIRFISGGLLSFIVYIITFKLYCFKNEITPEQARGFDSIGKIPFIRMHELISQAYQYFFDYFFNDNLYNNSWQSRNRCNVVIMFLLIATMLIIFLKNKLYKKIFESLILLFLVALIPLVFMSIVIFAPNVSIKEVTGILMLPHMNFIYVFLIVLIEKCFKNKWLENVLKYTAIISCIYMAIVLGMYTQIFQNCIEYELNRIYALSQRIVMKLENLPQYSPELKVVIGGRAEYGNYPRSYPEMYNVVKGTAINYGFFWDTIDGSQVCWNHFLHQYLGIEYNRASQEELIYILGSEEYAKMPIFPYEGSVTFINGIAVVKLSW